MENHNQNVKRRLTTSFCGEGKFQSPPQRSFTFGGRPHVVGVDVLLENGDVAIYHLKGLLDDEAVKALQDEGPEKDQRQRDVLPPAGGGLFSRDGPLTSLSKRVDSFVKEKLKDQQLGDDSKAQPFHIFRYGEKEIHVCVPNLPPT